MNVLDHLRLAIIPRDGLRQRGRDRLLVTRAHPFLQLLVLACTLTAQLYFKDFLLLLRAQLQRLMRCYFYLPF
jgi:hypothetical protein